MWKMPQLKIIFAILVLIRVLPSLDAYPFRSPKPNDWESLDSMFDDENKYYEDYGFLDSLLLETGGIGNGIGGNGGNGNGNGNCNGNAGKSNGGSCMGQSDDGPSDELAKACSKPTPKCNLNSLNRGNAKMTATGFAQKAANEAKAANDAQVPAAEAASFQAKCELAGKAIESAKGAEAVLAGKQELLEQARSDLANGEKEVTKLTNSMRCMQENAEMANNAVQDIQSVFNHVKNILHEAAKNLAALQCVAKGALQELTEKNQILKAAKFRAGNLNRQLAEAKGDFDKTKMAAYKAVCAAVEAKQKAQRARRMSWMFLDGLADYF